MRLVSLTVRNYRIHRERHIEFDPFRNVIGGPNESGKSTLAEAIHRALFLRAKTGGALREGMRSTVHAGEPEVVLAFEARGAMWTVEKRFAGKNGSAMLRSSTGAVFRDAEAERELTDILGCNPELLTGKVPKLAACWPHLWVWQGTSGDDPAQHANEHRDSLVQRLQGNGLSAVLQSANDQRVRERIAAAFEERFTSRGWKAGSGPDLASRRLAGTGAALQEAQQTAERLNQTAERYRRAVRESAEADALLPGLREQLAAAEAARAAIADLRRQEENAKREWQNAQNRTHELAAADEAIRQWSGQADSAREALAPAGDREADLTAAEQRAAALTTEADAEARQEAERVRTIRLQYDFAVACVTVREREAVRRALTDRLSEAERVRAAIAAHRESMSRLPVLTAGDVEELRRLDRAVSEAAAGLNAIATGVEIVSADQPVLLDGRPMAPGESHTITDDLELAVGEGVRIRIRPGGGMSLAEARRRLEAARHRMREALDRLTVRSPDEAVAVLEQRRTLEQQIAQLEVQWKALGGAALAEKAAAAAAEFDAAVAEMQRRGGVLDPALDQPDSVEAARQLRDSLHEALTRAGESESAARSRADLIRQQWQKAVAELQAHREQTARARDELRALETRLQVLQEAHGDAAARSSARMAAAAAEQEAASRLAAIRERIAAHSPDLIANDLERLTRAIRHLETRRQEAENERTVAMTLLARDGTSDPEADLAAARARLDLARDLYTAEERRASAIRLLHDLFLSAREDVSRSVVQPLADRISGYLRCVFGPGAGVRVNVSDDGIESFELVRPELPAFQFSSLSGGAKEQVAAAARLAMAEILADDHDGCLPIVFDDAFAFSDPERIHTLQRMLDLAATRGLQIIVLTCNPAEYATFGARPIALDSNPEP